MSGAVNKVLGSRVLAPLEGISDCAFRRLCHSLGATFTFSEMVRARALAARNKASFDLLDLHDEDVPTGIQLLTTSERELSDALQEIARAASSDRGHLHLGIRAIDLNFGCPSPEIIGIGAGPAMLKRTAKLGRIFDQLVRWREGSGPQRGALPRVEAVGVKIRLGLGGADLQRKVHLTVARLAREAGVDFLTIHGRHAGQESSERADWGAIAEAAEMATRGGNGTLAVLGNGDVFGAKDRDGLLAVAPALSGVMVARGAIRSPWVFRELAGCGSSLPTKEELGRAREKHFAAQANLPGASRPKFRASHEKLFAKLERLVDAASV